MQTYDQYLYHCVTYCTKLSQRCLPTGIQVAGGTSSVLHIFFANDNYIFCKAKRGAANHVVEVLAIFEKASGQKINVEKFSIFFSRYMDGGV